MSRSDRNLLDKMQSPRCCAEIASLNDAEASLLHVFCSYEEIDTGFLIRAIKEINCTAGSLETCDLSADCYGLLGQGEIS